METQESLGGRWCEGRHTLPLTKIDRQSGARGFIFLRYPFDRCGIVSVHWLAEHRRPVAFHDSSILNLPHSLLTSCASNVNQA